MRLDRKNSLCSRSFIRGSFRAALWLPSILICCIAVVADEDPSQATYVWNLPAGFPEPIVAESNPMSASKVELGRYLFYDQRLSINGQYSCASCHQQDKAFTDALPLAMGATNQLHSRNTMVLANVAYSASLTWASNAILTLEDQIHIPLFNQNPVEIGIKGKEAEVIELLKLDRRYQSLFAQSFPGQTQTFSIDNIIFAMAAFVRTLISGNSIYDRLVYQDERNAMSDSAWRGMRLFFSDTLKCAQCHQGFNFPGPLVYVGAEDLEPEFHNTALYNADGEGAYPLSDQGLYIVTGNKKDMGKFRAPSLRNIEYTAPYMHDGSIATLEAVIDHYARGGRSRNPFQDSLITGFAITKEGREDLLNFLLTLSDSSFLSGPLFSDPQSSQ